jgi:adenosylhomocysteinase
MTDPTTRVSAELARIQTFFPLLPTLGNRWAMARPWEGLTIGLHLHLTTLTASLVRELVLGGGTWIVSAANSATTDQGVTEYLREMGIVVYSGGGREDAVGETLDAEPHLFADVGFALGAGAVARGYRPRGGVELTRSGVTRLRALAPLPFPVMNINDGRLKPAVENRHGVGEGLWQAFTALTGVHLAGHRVCVIGYGPVGSGVAHYARAGGAQVDVVESDPVRRLIAHYDGFGTNEEVTRIRRAQIIVTATGTPRSLPVAALEHARDGAVLINAGHGADEIDVRALRKMAEGVDHVSPRVVRYRLPTGRHVVVLADGNKGGRFGKRVEERELQLGWSWGEIPAPEVGLIDQAHGSFELFNRLDCAVLYRLRDCSRNRHAVFEAPSARRLAHPLLQRLCDVTKCRLLFQKSTSHASIIWGVSDLNRRQHDGSVMT